MAPLKEQLLNEDIRPLLVRDCCTLIDQEVGRKRGLKGLALKAAYKAVKTIRRGFVSGVVNALLDEWVEELECFYAEFEEADERDFASFVDRKRSLVAEALLKVTDRRAQSTTHRTAAKLYNRQRPNAKTQVEESVAGLGRVVAKHLN